MFLTRIAKENAYRPIQADTLARLVHYFWPAFLLLSRGGLFENPTALTLLKPETFMNAVLEELAQQETVADRRYHDLCFAAGRNEMVDVGEIASILAIVDRGREQFKRDVATVAARLRAADDLRRADQLEPEGVPLREARMAAAAELDELTKRHRREREAAELRFEKASGESTAHARRVAGLRADANKALLTTADPQLAARIAELEHRCIGLQNERSTLSMNPRVQEQVAGINESLAKINREVAELRRKQRDPSHVAL